jgi:hypothetical protein
MLALPAAGLSARSGYDKMWSSGQLFLASLFDQIPYRYKTFS